jgi:hypothetical protein
VAAASSIDKATVAFDKGEMSFGMFEYSKKLDAIIAEGQTSVETLKKLRDKIGNGALPKFLIDYIEVASQNNPGSLAIHTASSIAGYGSRADQKAISRGKGFMGKSQLEPNKFPEAVHHIKIFYNNNGKAKVFYKFVGSLQFMQNIK